METETQVQATIVFDQVRTALRDPNVRIILLQGGARASKTISVMQALIEYVEDIEDPCKITISRKEMTTMRESILLDFPKVTGWMETDYYPVFNKNRDDQTYYVGYSESPFLFTGMDNPMKAHGREQDIFWGNEAMELSKKDFDQVENRTAYKIILDYNPSDIDSWVFELLKRDDVVRIMATVLDNPFAPLAVRKKIMSYNPDDPENVRQGTADRFMWQVYGLGIAAKLQGVVFENWDVVPNVPDYAKALGMGMDFGYSNDPTTLMELYMSDNELYINELIYETGLTNPDIVDRMKALGVSTLYPIYGDSAEPKSIEEIRRSGYSNMQAVEKGQDSINFGIDILKGFKIHITQKSVNTQSEFRKYKWTEDKNGKILNKPIDDFNHAIDAVRYAAMMILKKKQAVTLHRLEVI